MLPASSHPSVTRAPYGVLPTGERVDSFTLGAGRGVTMRCITYGAIITHLHAPDRRGEMDDVVLGHDHLDGYLTASPYFGAVVGRYANRIALGRFTLDGEAHQLSVNDGANHLHGGVRGFDKVVWSAESIEESEAVGVRLVYESADGEEGYPGALSALVEYRLTTNELRIDYRATATRPTPVNLTQHSYWNLGGARSASVLDHELAVDASRFTPVDATLIPTGELREVAGTPFDFRSPTPIGARIAQADEQLRRAGGYDHNFVLDPGTREGALRGAARLRDPVSGRTLDVLTTEPGLQVYSGNFLDGSIRGKGGRSYGHRAAVCLETQHFPDSPNQAAFPPAVARPDGGYASSTVFRFSVTD